MTLTGVIQAGGKSTRMGGEPKALMELGGQRIIERIVDVLGSVLPDVLIVTNTPELYAFLGLPLVPDVFPDHGSLGGIYSGLKAAKGEAAFTVACDMPFLKPEVVRLVVSHAGEADVVIPKVGDQYETLHALYAKVCLPHMEAVLQARRFKVVGFFPQVKVLEIPEAEVARLADPRICFLNVNTPDELARARSIAVAGM
ncbi:MAG: molybdenum cofactor guanylyltransferase [Candidatus Rokubacteria bacterium]|nr:molybdenum cofactor guanylyltransferase [Candidatus Rokubacteria bacterium]